MSEERKTLHQRIGELLKRHEQSRAEIAALRARAKDLDRKLDARLKIIGGAAVYAHAAANSSFLPELRKVLQVAVRRPADRALLAEHLPQFFAESRAAAAPAAAPPNLAEAASGAAPPQAASLRQQEAAPAESSPETGAAPAPPARPPKKGEPPSGAAPAY